MLRFPHRGIQEGLLLVGEGGERGNANSSNQDRWWAVNDLIPKFSGLFFFVFFLDLIISLLKQMLTLMRNQQVTDVVADRDAITLFSN